MNFLVVAIVAVETLGLALVVVAILVAETLALAVVALVVKALLAVVLQVLVVEVTVIVVLLVMTVVDHLVLVGLVQDYLQTLEALILTYHLRVLEESPLHVHLQDNLQQLLITLFNQDQDHLKMVTLR